MQQVPGNAALDGASARPAAVADEAAAKPLAGRHAAVTGASRGIGWAVARELARLGARVSLIARDAAALRARAGELGSADLEAIDVCDGAAVRDGFAALARRQGPVDVLVNNAGSGRSVPFVKMDDAHWREMIELNLNGTFSATRAVLPGMIEGGWGRIINIASTAGVTGYAYVAAYCAAKHGVIGLTRALALELAQKNVTVNAVCPGYTETEMTAGTLRNIVAKTGRSEAEARAELVRTNPQRRLVQPEEVAAAVGFLALPAAASVTGQAIVVAGGEVMP